MHFVKFKNQIAMSNKKNVEIEGLENVEEALSRTEKFIEENQKIILMVVAAIAIIVLGYFGYVNYIFKPKVEEAAASMYQAERYFEQDSLKLALYGDGNNFGFLYIIDEYSGTPSANLAKYYAGVSYLHLGDYDKAIDFLLDYNGKDLLIKTLALSALGDAYAQKGNLEKAAKYYLEAAENKADKFNVPLCLLKAGAAFEELNKYEKALKVYRQIETEYSDSREARGIEKYIARVEGLLKK